MTVQSDRQTPGVPKPVTLSELRTVLARYGLPGDGERFEQALDATGAGDLAAVAEVVSAYRHRLALRNTPGAMASLAVPIGGRRWTLAAAAFSRARAAGGAG
ncbi:hypothetical protein OHV05_38005 (plasmid) [Kitasatospora sp. NBC_00070]|uniref:hypothetical protein n=1 Tax=Kitasatospora sp. NBC_00070 TaxID=2975962 RepID=UPI00324D4070